MLKIKTYFMLNAHKKYVTKMARNTAYDDQIRIFGSVSMLYLVYAS